MAELNRLIVSNPEFPVYYATRASLNWHLKNVDAFAGDRVALLKTTGRPEEAEAFSSGYAKAKLKGACTALIRF